MGASISCSADGFESVGPDVFGQVLAADSTTICVDVRTPDEFAAGHLAGAVNIDVKDPSFREKALARLPKQRRVAVYCRSGKRSKVAAGILSAAGYQVVELDNGYLGWVGSGKPVVK